MYVKVTVSQCMLIKVHSVQLLCKVCHCCRELMTARNEGQHQFITGSCALIISRGQLLCKVKLATITTAENKLYNIAS